MNKYIVSLVVTLLVGVGLGYALFHRAAPEPGLIGSYRATSDHFVGGLYAGSTDQLSVNTSGELSTPTSTVTALFTTERFKTETIGSSSSTPSALGAAASFFMTATGTSQSASTTAILSSNSMVFLQFASTTPIAGTSCNAGAPATSTVAIIASTTNTSNNGFIVRYPTAPSGSVTPYCLYGWIVSNN